MENPFSGNELLVIVLAVLFALALLMIGVYCAYIEWQKPRRQQSSQFVIKNRKRELRGATRFTGGGLRCDLWSIVIADDRKFVVGITTVTEHCGASTVETRYDHLYFLETGNENDRRIVYLALNKKRRLEGVYILTPARNGDSEQFTVVPMDYFPPELLDQPVEAVNGLRSSEFALTTSNAKKVKHIWIVRLPGFDNSRVTAEIVPTSIPGHELFVLDGCLVVRSAIHKSRWELVHENGYASKYTRIAAIERLGTTSFFAIMQDFSPQGFFVRVVRLDSRGEYQDHARCDYPFLFRAMPRCLAAKWATSAAPHLCTDGARRSVVLAPDNETILFVSGSDTKIADGRVYAFRDGEWVLAWTPNQKRGKTDTWYFLEGMTQGYQSGGNTITLGYLKKSDSKWTSETHHGRHAVGMAQELGFRLGWTPLEEEVIEEASVEV